MGAWLHGLQMIEHKRQHFPLDLNQTQRLLGNLLALGCYRDPQNSSPTQQP